jgi:hypothetical protein
MVQPRPDGIHGSTWSETEIETCIIYAEDEVATVRPLADENVQRGKRVLAPQATRRRNRRRGSRGIISRFRSPGSSLRRKGGNAR